MLIEVMQEHIDKGRVGHCCLCPIALAIKDKLPGHSVAVGEDFFRLKKDGFLPTSSRLPLVAQGFIEDFDRGMPVKPFSFELEAPK